MLAPPRRTIGEIIQWRHRRVTGGAWFIVEPVALLELLARSDVRLTSCRLLDRRFSAGPAGSQLRAEMSGLHPLSALVASPAAELSQRLHRVSQPNRDLRLRNIDRHHRSRLSDHYIRPLGFGDFDRRRWLFDLHLRSGLLDHNALLLFAAIASIRASASWQACALPSVLYRLACSAIRRIPGGFCSSSTATNLIALSYDAFFATLRTQRGRSPLSELSC